ncbi:hypothetical protein [Modestobacter versicolor]|uniref:hypothetical protein n=1 Tax=Modestobacter versicolor TaxID=429133 RepID=UPI0034DE9C40
MPEAAAPAGWLLVASRPPAPHTGDLWADATALRRTGAAVTVIATDDVCAEAVLGLGGVPGAVAAGVTVLVDSHAAERRNLAGRLPAGTAGGPCGATDDEVAALLLDPALRTVWR